MTDFVNAKGLEKSFEVSSCGLIRSKGRFVKNWPTGKRYIKGRLLKCSVTKAGYKVVDFRSSDRNSGGTDYVHRIVYRTFVGAIPKGMTIDHIDGNKKNNNINNLELVTQSENSLRAWRIGLCDGQKQPVICHSNGVGMWFPSMSCTGFANPSLVHAVLEGRQKTHRGMLWERV